MDRLARMGQGARDPVGQGEALWVRPGPTAQAKNKRPPLGSGGLWKDIRGEVKLGRAAAEHPDRAGAEESQEGSQTDQTQGRDLDDRLLRLGVLAQDLEEEVGARASAH